MKPDRVMMAEAAQKIYNEYSNVFTGTGCFKGTLLYRS